MNTPRIICSALLCSAAFSLLDCSDRLRRVGHAGQRSRKAATVSASDRPDTGQLREGDIIFHKSNSSQSLAIRIATQSEFNHVGVIFQHNSQWMVFEAVQPVKFTPLGHFIDRGGGHYVIKRLKDYDQVMTPPVIAKMKILGRNYVGKNYDIYFRWDDDRIYCSELVWKLYKQAAHVEIGRLQKAEDLNLGNPVVQRLIKQRYGPSAAVPLHETIISPQSMFESDRLIVVQQR